MLDMNANIYTSSFACKLGEMVFEELFQRTNSARAPYSHIDGSEPICAVFVTQGIDCQGYFISRHEVGAGDHRIHAFDLTQQSIYGTSAPTPARRPGRKLQCSQIRTTDVYRNTLEKDSDRHKLENKLDVITACTDAHGSQASNALSARQINALNDKFDREHTELEIHAENVCRKKKDGMLPWTPDSGAWWNRRRVYTEDLSSITGEGSRISRAYAELAKLTRSSIPTRRLSSLLS